MNTTKSPKSRSRGGKSRTARKKTSLSVERELRENTDAAGVKIAKFQVRKKEANVALGQRIAEFRVLVGCKRQKDFAIALGVSRAAVGNWERGVGASRESLDLIAKQFNGSLEWLMTGKGEMIVGSNEKRFAKTSKRMKLLPPGEFELFESDVRAMLDARLARIGVTDGGR